MNARKVPGEAEGRGRGRGKDEMPSVTRHGIVGGATGGGVDERMFRRDPNNIFNLAYQPNTAKCTSFCYNV